MSRNTFCIHERGTCLVVFCSTPDRPENHTLPHGCYQGRVRVRREETSMVSVSLENILRGLKLTSGRRGKFVVVEHILTESALASDLESSSKFIDFRLERGGTPPRQI